MAAHISIIVFVFLFASRYYLETILEDLCFVVDIPFVEIARANSKNDGAMIV